MSQRVTAQAKSGPFRVRNPYARKAKKPSVKKAVAKLESKVNKLSKNDEMKRLDVLSAGNAISNTGTYVLLNGIAQGDDADDREGNEVMCSSLYLKGEITNSDATNTTRIMVVWDTQANGVQPTDANLFAFTAYPHLSTNNYDLRRRFRILMDEVFVTDTDDPVSYFKRYIKIGKKTQYTAGSGTIVQISKGSLYLVAVSDSGVVSHPTLTFQSRLHFNA